MNWKIKFSILSQLLDGIPYEQNDEQLASRTFYNEVNQHHHNIHVFLLSHFFTLNNHGSIHDTQISSTISVIAHYIMM